MTYSLFHIQGGSRYHLLKRWFLPLFISLLVSSSAYAQRVVQSYLVPFEEDDVYLSLNTIDDFDGQIGSTLRSTISLVAGVDSTIIYWDHWEDGYEVNSINPTQSTTQVWGDSNSTNGIPPGYTNDVIDAGDIITLLTDITVPRVTSTITYDGRDKFSVTRWVAMSRAMYALDPGEVLAGSAQMYDKGNYGFNFRAPVGINVGTNQMFEYAAMYFMAGHNSTVVQIDSDNDGAFEDTLFLDQGESHIVLQVSVGATIVASKPAQCHMITGDIGSNYEMRWFTLFPERQWYDSYYTPVGSASGGTPVEIYIFNPNPNALTVHWESASVTSSVTVASEAVNTVLMPTGSGAHFFSTNNQRFVPISTMDANQSISGNQAYDWGHGMVSDKTLTSMSLIPWGPGVGGSPLSNNGNPVWVTPVSNAVLYIDYDADPSTGPLVDPSGRNYDFSTNVSPMQTVKIYDPDNDQTGMRIYTLDDTHFTTAWGQDPDTAGTGNPYLDMGSAILPFPTVPAVKEASLYIDLDTNGVASPGDSLLFSITVENIGFALTEDVTVLDSGASNTAYTLSSTTVNGTNVVDDSVPPFTSEFPLDENGLNIGSLDVGQTALVSYVVQIDDPFPTNTDGVINGVFVDQETTVFVPVPHFGFEITKTSTPTNPVYIGETISYTILVEGTATVAQAGVRVSDPLPADTYWVTNSTEVYLPGQFDGSVRDEFNIDAEYYGSDGQLYWESDWIEVNESDGAGSGDIQVMPDGGAPGSVYMLRVRNANHGAYRVANLAQFTNLVLSFDFRRDSLESSSEYVGIYASSNGGAAWAEVGRVVGPTEDATYQSSNINISAYAATNTAIRFYSSGSVSDQDYFWFDNVDILASGSGVTNRGGSPSILIDEYAMGSNDTLEITFDVVVLDSIIVSQVVNQAYVSSFNSPTPVSSTVTNTVILPLAADIIGSVKNDTDGDGDLLDADLGMTNITVSLFSDPNGDGDPSDGTVLETLVTDSTGTYVFAEYHSDNYVILETDRAGYRSTADADGGNPNLIAIDTRYPEPDDPSAKSVDASTTPLVVSPNNATGTTDGVYATVVSVVGQSLVLDLGASDEGTGNMDVYYSGVTAAILPTIDFLAADNTVLGSWTTLLDVGLDPKIVTVIYTNSPVSYRKVRFNAEAASAYLVDSVLTKASTDAQPSTNNVFLDSRVGEISGWVRHDSDADGDITDAETGITNITVTLYSDPNGDGDPADGSALSNVLTDVDGAFAFMSIDTGTYVIVETDPVDFISTGDSQGTNDNEIALTMVGASDSTNNVFLDAVSGLTITKTSLPPGIWYPELVATYVITVVNTGAVDHANVDVTDVLSSGFTYSSNSTYVVSGTITTNDVMDQFGASAFTNNYGSIDWTEDWIESDGGGSGPGSGSIRVTGGQLRLRDGVSGTPHIYREVDISTFIDATLTYDYDTSGNLESSDYIDLDISTDGSAWTQLARYTNDVSGSASFDLSSYISASTFIRFEVAQNYGGSGEYFYIDDVRIHGRTAGSSISTGGAPPALLSSYTLNPGEALTITFTGTVGLVDGVTNSACVVSDELPSEICDTVINIADSNAIPDRISGQVREDIDGDGDLNDPDNGVGGITILLYSDPNGDGDPADGQVLGTNITTGGGYYIFGGLSVGSYVITETDLVAWQSMADADGTNDNQIAVSLVGGMDAINNDFLDMTISGLGIEKTASDNTELDPGDTITYSIAITNTRSTVQTGINVSDPLPAGLTWMTGSTHIYSDDVGGAETFRDTFTFPAWTNNNGTQDWSTEWQESGDDGSPVSGDLQVRTDLGNTRMRVRDDNNSLTRSCNLGSFNSAQLELDFRRQGLEPGEYVALEIRTNAASWVELDRFSNDGGSSTSDSSYKYTNYNINAYLSSNTQIRLKSPSGSMSNGDAVYLDNIEIEGVVSGVVDVDGDAPPTLLTNFSLAGGGLVTITFTATVGMVDEVVNTACVTTPSDTNGLCSTVSNGVASIAMTQGVHSAESMAAVKLSWVATTDEQGDVIKEYDLLYADQAYMGFTSSITDEWKKAATVLDSKLVEDGGGPLPSLLNAGNTLRFYRAARKDRWLVSNPTRVASEEVYTAKCIELEEGENWVSLFMVPDSNCVADVLGTNRLPSANLMGNATRIEWYGSTLDGGATNIIWLSSSGNWLYQGGGIADGMPFPLHEGFNIVIPEGSNSHPLVVIGKVPSFVSTLTGHRPTIEGGGKYNVVSYNIPYKVRLVDSGLREAGLEGAPSGELVNPNNSDEIRIMQRGAGSLGSPKARILIDGDDNYVYWTGGSGLANNYRLEVDDALVIYTRVSTNTFQWNQTLPYPAPTTTMSP